MTDFDLSALEKTERSADILKFEGKPVIDEEARTVELAFASEYPVFRNFPWGKGYEVIDLERMDLGRLEDKAALLAEHDPNSQIGVVETVSQDAGGKSRAVVKFGRSAKATDYFNDVIDGIRTKVSFGYEITDVREDGEHEGYPVYRVATSPFELSIVSIPADSTVGVGRAKEIKEDSTEDIVEPQKDIIMENEVKAEINVEDIRAKEAAKIQSNMEKILKRGQQLDLSKEATDAIQRGMSIQDFEKLALDVLQKRNDQMQVSMTDLGVSEKEQRKYSLMNIVRAAQDPSNAAEIMSFEREVSNAIADKFGRSAKGCFVPHEVFARDMNTGVPSEGGDLVGTDHLGNEAILALHDRTVLNELGVRSLNGLVGNIDIPKVAGLPSVQWIAEGAAPTDSELTLASVTMSPKTIAGAVPFTRRLSLQSDPSVEALISQEILTTLAVGIDEGCINGAVGGPTGLLATAGVLTQSVAAAGQPTWGEIVGFETQVASANALMGRPSYLTTPGVVGSLKTTSKDSGSGLMLMTDAGTVNGHPVMASNILAANTIVFGDWAQLIIGYWGALDLVADTATQAASGGTVIRVFQDLDMAVRYPEAFCQNA